MERQNQIRDMEVENQQEPAPRRPRVRAQEIQDTSRTLRCRLLIGPKSKRWFLGVQSRKDAAVIMIEVCKTIAKLGYQWYIESEYRVRCRQTTNVDQKQLVTEMRLQLYKVQEHTYLLDFQKMEGNVCSFMHMCGTVIDQLQKGLSRSTHTMCRREGGE